jgi:hypothetical protein
VIKVIPLPPSTIKLEIGDCPKEVEMSQRHAPTIERLLHRIEDHVEEWRKQDKAHKAEAAAQRENPEVAAQRENL